MPIIDTEGLVWLRNTVLSKKGISQFTYLVLKYVLGISEGSDWYQIEVCNRILFIGNLGIEMGTRP